MSGGYLVAEAKKNWERVAMSELEDQRQESAPSKERAGRRRCLSRRRGS